MSIMFIAVADHSPIPRIRLGEPEASCDGDDIYSRGLVIAAATEEATLCR
jgi:hypothetical protein